MRSSRNAQLGVVGVIGAIILVAFVGANALGIVGGSPKPSPVAGASVAPTATAVATAGATAVASPSASAEPSSTPVPSPTPLATPTKAQAPLTGEMVDPAIARRHPIAV